MNFIFITWMVIQCTYNVQKCYPKAYELMFWVGFFFFTIYSQWPQQEKKTQLQQINDIKNQ